MVDLQGKPAYQPQSCPVCTEHRATDRNLGKRTCQSCGGELSMDDANTFGFEAQSINHWHLKSVEGVGAAQAIMLRLCRKCYLEDFKLVYPNEEPPQKF